MLGYYTRDFRAENVEAAVDYITLICLNADLRDRPDGRRDRVGSSIPDQCVHLISYCDYI